MLKASRHDKKYMNRQERKMGGGQFKLLFFFKNGQNLFHGAEQIHPSVVNYR